jgi:hypothetical protein
MNSRIWNIDNFVEAILKVFKYIQPLLIFSCLLTTTFLSILIIIIDGREDLSILVAIMIVANIAKYFAVAVQNDYLIALGEKLRRLGGVLCCHIIDYIEDNFAKSYVFGFEIGFFCYAISYSVSMHQKYLTSESLESSEDKEAF